MESQPIEYGHVERPSFRRVSLCVAIGVLVALALFVLPSIEVATTWHRVDAVTGSTMVQTDWPLGFSGRARVTPSPLERRLRSMGLEWKRDWRPVGCVGSSVLGNTVSRGCGPAPAIYQLGPAQVQYAETASDKDVLGLVSVLQSGTDAQQRTALDDAVEKVFWSLTPGRPRQ